MNVMKKMNRSQSSYRQCKTLVNQDDSENWESRLHSRHNSRAQINIGNSFMDADKENNSLFQSVSQRNFPKANPINDFDPAQELLRQLEQKCKRQQQELKMFYQQRQENMKGSTRSTPFNYSQKYYQSQIESLKNLIRKKDQELELYREQQVSRNQEMSSIASEMENKIEKDSRDKNLLVKQLNQKTIEANHLIERVKIHKSQIQTLKLYIKQKDKTIKEIEDKISQSDMRKKKIDSYQVQLKERDQFLHELQLNVRKLKSETQQKETKIEQKTKIITELQEMVDSYDDKLKSMEYHTIKMKEDIKNIKETNQNLREEVDDWKKSYDQLLIKNESSQQFEIKLKTYQNMLEDANKKNMQLMSANQKFKISIGSLEKSLNKSQQMQKQLSSTKRQLKQKQQKIMELQSKEKDYKHLQEYYSRLRKQKDDIFAKLQEKIKQNKSLTIQIDQSKTTISSLEQELEEIQSDNIRGKEQRQKMDILMKENDRLNTLVIEKVGQIEKLQIKLNAMDNRVGQKNNQNLKLKAVINDKDQEINELKAEVQNFSQRYQMEVTNRLLSQQKISKCNQQIIAQRSLIESIQNKNKNLCIQMQKIVEKYEFQMNEMKEIISCLDEQKKQTQFLLQQSKQNTSNLKRDVQDCKKIIQEATSREKIHIQKLQQIQNKMIEIQDDRDRLLRQKKQIIDKNQQLKQIYDFISKFKE